MVAALAVYWALLALAGCSGQSAGPPPPPPNPTPTVSALSPAATYSGTGGFPLTVNGSGFLASSTVQWNGSTRATTFVSSSQLMAQIPSSDLSAPGTASITVVNPSPGGGTSNTLSFMLVPGPAPGTGVIQLISVAADGTPSNGNSFTPPAISADGRYMAFQSDATNLVAGPASGFADIYVRDTCLSAPTGCTPTTIRASVAADGSLANGNSRSAAISADGRYVAFDSSATNLVPNDTNGPFLADVFVRDTCVGAPVGCMTTTTRVSVASDGTEANNDSRGASISADGRFVAFSSGATNLIVGDTNPAGVAVRDSCANAAPGCTPSTFRAAVASDGTQDGTGSGITAISANGRFVTFLSFATNVVPGDTNGEPDAFVRDTCFGAPSGCTPSTMRISLAGDGAQANARTDNSSPSPITGNGRLVAFTSFATNLVPGDTNDFADVFVRDTCVNGAPVCTLSTRRVSVVFEGSQANNGSHEPSVSGDGRFVVFSSLATNLTPGGISAPKHVFLRDTCFSGPTGCIPTTILLSITPDRFHGDGISDSGKISADGRFVVFRSNSTNLIPGGSNGNLQIFLARTGF